MPKYVYDGAKMICSSGTDSAYLVVEDRGMDGGADDRYPAFREDRVPGKNIPSFGECKITKKPCNPNTVMEWIETVKGTSYRRLGTDYTLAYDEFRRQLKSFVNRVNDFEVVVARLVDTYDTAYYKSQSDNIKERVKEYKELHAKTIKSKIDILALAPEFSDEEAMELYGYQEYSQKLEEIYNDIKAEAKQLTAPSEPNLYRVTDKTQSRPTGRVDPTQPKDVYLAFREAEVAYEALLKIQEERLKKLNDNRLVMESRLYCKETGNIMFLSEGRAIGDPHNIEQRLVGVYDTKKRISARDVYLEIVGADIIFYVQYDEHTDLHFLVDTLDVEYLVCILGLRETGLYSEADRFRYDHMSLEEILKEANIELPFDIAARTYYLTLDLESNTDRIADAILLAGQKVEETAKDTKVELRGEKTLNVKFPPVPFPGGMMEPGVEVKYSGTFDLTPLTDAVAEQFAHFSEMVAQEMKGAKFTFNLQPDAQADAQAAAAQNPAPQEEKERSNSVKVEIANDDEAKTTSSITIKTKNSEVKLQEGKINVKVENDSGSVGYERSEKDGKVGQQSSVGLNILGGKLNVKFSGQMETTVGYKNELVDVEIKYLVAFIEIMFKLAESYEFPQMGSMLTAALTPYCKVYLFKNKRRIPPDKDTKHLPKRHDSWSFMLSRADDSLFAYKDLAAVNKELGKACTMMCAPISEIITAVVVVVAVVVVMVVAAFLVATGAIIIPIGAGIATIAEAAGAITTIWNLAPA